MKTAGAILPVEDLDGVASAAEAFGGGEDGGSGADDVDAAIAFAVGGEGRAAPAAGPGGFGDMGLDGADDNAAETLLDDAVTFAQAVLGVDFAADFGEGISG